MTERTERDGATRGRWRWAAVAVAVVAALVVLGVLVGRDGEGAADDRSAAGSSAVTTPPESSAEAVPSGSPSTTAPAPAPSAGASADPVDADTLPDAMPPVAFDQPVVVEGITASVTAIESIDGQATGPGDVAGPAVRVTVRIDNPSQETVTVDGVSVNVFSGSELTPATPLGDPSQDPLAGEVAAGGSAQGVYVFSVPASAQDEVTVQVGYRAGAPLAVFTGAVS